MQKKITTRYHSYPLRWAACIGLLLLLTMSACSVHIEKRRYRPGYHIDLVKNKQPHSTFARLKSTPVLSTSCTIQNIHAPVKDSVTSSVFPVIPVHQKLPVHVVPAKTSRTVLSDIDACDTIVLTDQTRIIGRIVSMSNDQVRYRKCNDVDEPNAPVFVISMEIVAEVHKGNGNSFKPYRTQPKQGKLSIPNKGQTAFVMAIVALAIALVCFTMSFFISPFSYFALFIGMADLIYTTVVSIYSIKPFKTDRSIKTILALTLSIVAIVLLIATMILVFV